MDDTVQRCAHTCLSGPRRGQQCTDRGDGVLHGTTLCRKHRAVRQRMAQQSARVLERSREALAASRQREEAAALIAEQSRVQREQDRQIEESLRIANIDPDHLRSYIYRHVVDDLIGDQVFAERYHDHY